MEGVKKDKNMEMEIGGKWLDGNKNMNDSKNGKNRMKSWKRKQGQKSEQNKRKRMNDNFQNQKNMNACNKRKMKPINKIKGIKKTEGKKTLSQSHPEENVKMDVQKTKNKIKGIRKQNVSKSYPKGEENVKMNIQNSTKKRKIKNKDFWVSSEKMELTPLLNQETEGRTSHRDERTLYVRFPPSLNVREKSLVKLLVPSAMDIRFPRLSPGCYAKFCYIEFETIEETAKMLSKISSIRINGELFYADFVGKKSKTYCEKETRIVDSFRLYVGGLPTGIKYSDLKAAFPTAVKILYKKPNNKVSVSVAYLLFETHEEALTIFNASKNLKLLGKEVIVMFATYKDKNKHSKVHEAKKQKKKDVGMEDGNSEEGNGKLQMDIGADDIDEGNMDVDAECDED